MNPTTRKAEANSYFKKKDYQTASRLYSELLEEDPENEILLNNRSAARIASGNYKEALIDALKVLSISPENVKAIYRSAKAYCGLKKFDKAIDVLNTARSLTIDDQTYQRDIRKLKEKAQVYLKQQQTGDYDMMSFLRSEGKPVYHDIAEYCVPLKLVNLHGKGRGLVATASIDAGQIIMACKAFAIDFENQNVELLLKKLEEVLKQDPQKTSELCKLYPGPTFVNRNLDPHELFELDPNNYMVNAMKLDIRRAYLSNIIQHNGLYCKKGGSGIWIEPSYINNDCLDFNSFYTIYGDVLVVRAVRSIKTGDEILLSYFGPRYSYVDRDQMHSIAIHDGFDCVCGMCEIQKQEDSNLRQKRGRLLEYFHSKHFDTSLNLVEVNAKVRQLKVLCRGIPKLHRKHFMFNAMFIQAKAHMCNNNRGKAIELLEDLATNKELNLTDVFGSYGVGAHLRSVFNLLLGCLVASNEKGKVKKLFPLMLQNFEVTEGKVGLEGYLLSQPVEIQSFVTAIYN